MTDKFLYDGVRKDLFIIYLVKLAQYLLECLKIIISNNIRLIRLVRDFSILPAKVILEK